MSETAANRPPSRRRFVKRAAFAAGAALTGAEASAQQMGKVRGFDHVALPMRNTDAMLAFYRALGFDVAENAVACSVYIGDQMINFHRPVTWQRESFTLRAPAANLYVRDPDGSVLEITEQLRTSGYMRPQLSSTRTSLTLLDLVFGRGLVVRGLIWVVFSARCVQVRQGDRARGSSAERFEIPLAGGAAGHRWLPALLAGGHRAFRFCAFDTA
jgi:hypothetical protein